MTAAEVKVLAVTARLRGEPLSYAEGLREAIVKSAIWQVRPLPFPTCWLDITPLEMAGEALGQSYGQIIKTRAYKVLRIYHCSGYFSIPRQIRRRIPELVREVLGGAR